MAQPTPYDLGTEFISLPDDQLKTRIQAELQAVEVTLDETLVNLALIQRDDGLLANESVHIDALTTAVLNLMGGYTPRGLWVTATAYALRDVVSKDAGTYLCIVAHTSGVFATDLAAGKWTLIAGTSGTANLDSLTDVVITSAALAQVLKYNGTNWVNGLVVGDSIDIEEITFDHLDPVMVVRSNEFDFYSPSVSEDTIFTTAAVAEYLEAAAHPYNGSINIGSGSTIGLDGNTNYLLVNGSGGNTINTVTMDQYQFSWVRFQASMTITHNATSLICPGAANLSVFANSRVLFYSPDGTNVIILTVQHATAVPPNCGTMASQNASAVAITGGTIGGAVTGATQSIGDASTKLATTAYTDNSVNRAKNLRLVYYGEYSSVSTIATSIPVDGTLPQNTEGTEILNSGALTPKDANSKFIVQFSGFGGGTTNAAQQVSALFVNSTADALHGMVADAYTDSDSPVCMSWTYRHSPASASAQTYKVRVGRTTGTYAMNGQGGAQPIGVAGKCTLTVWEEFG